MKIDLEWIQKELDAGREVELECVDREGYEKRHRLNKTLFREGLCLEVLEVWDDEVINLKRLVDSPMDGLHLIRPHEFEHFRIKRSAPTFDDFIDIAVQAQKDKLINHLKIDNVDHYLGFEKSCGTISAWDYQCLGRGIQYIKSLYTETFVIESEEDLKGLFTVDENMTITTVSGSVFRFGDFGNLIMLSTSTLFKLIKGATVTRKRG